MEHCQDLNVGSFVNIKDAIRKPWDKGLSCEFSVNGECFRELADSVDGGFESRCKLVT